jgi:peptide/nickel transport system substrate-binding protein
MQIDSAQYVERTNAYDFDMTHFVRLMSLSPGNEQWLYWGSEGVELPGTRNLAGVDSPAVEAMITTMLETGFGRDLHRRDAGAGPGADGGALRVPFWFSPVSRLAIAQGCISPSACQFTATGRGSCPKSGGTRNDAPVAMLALLMLVVVLAGCGTVEGIGRDISDASVAVRGWLR